MGAPADLIETCEAAFLSPDGFMVLPDNWEALTLFLAADSQWRYAGPVAVALDYPGVEAAARMSRIEIGPGLLGQIKVIEAAAVAAMVRRLR